MKKIKLLRIRKKIIFLLTGDDKFWKINIVIIYLKLKLKKKMFYAFRFLDMKEKI